jgi:hypothetical protein
LYIYLVIALFRLIYQTKRALQILHGQPLQARPSVQASARSYTQLQQFQVSATSDLFASFSGVGTPQAHSVMGDRRLQSTRPSHPELLTERTAQHQLQSESLTDAAITIAKAPDLMDDITGSQLMAAAFD